MAESRSGREPIPRSSDFRTDINGLRALSVALVVFFHVNLRGSGGGFIGVDIFFVISGFLMTKIIFGQLDAGMFSYWRFVEARAARIWPALGAMVLVLLGLGALLLPPSDLLHMAKEALWPLVFWSNQVFHDHFGYATQGPDGNWFLHTWSLSVEWQFYMLYPLLALLLTRARTGLRLAVLGTLFGLSLACHIVLSSKDPNSAFFLLPARAWEMLAGGLVYFLSDIGGSQRQRSIASHGGVVLILLSALWLGFRHLDPVGLGWYSIPPVAGAMLVLWSASPRNRFFDNRPTQAIGRWSYSIYLWHWPLVAACAMDAVFTRYPHPGKELVIVASVVLGWLSFRFVESPWRGGVPAIITMQRFKPMLAVGGGIVAALLVAQTGGLEFRMPPRPGEVPVKQAEESDYFPERCGNFQKEIVDVQPCIIDRHTQRAVLVIGDSLAEHLYPWFDKNSQATVEFFTESECPPVPNFDRMQPGFHCLDFAREAWRKAALPAYDTVVISAGWNLVGGAGPPYCHAVASGACEKVTGEQRTALVLSELRASMSALLKAGKTVVVLDGTPEAHVSIPQRLERERFWFGKPRLTISVPSVLEDYAWIDPMFASLVGTPGYHLVSLRPTLCNATSCKVYDEALNRPVFVDSRHFDAVWMAGHGQVFEPFVQSGGPAAR